jgi:hypothetical protein
MEPPYHCLSQGGAEILSTREVAQSGSESLGMSVTQDYRVPFRDVMSVAPPPRVLSPGPFSDF